MGALHFLDLVIGLVFLFFLLSIICVAFFELVANFTNERSKDLEKWIKDTFNKTGQSDGLGDRIWNNIMVDGLTKKGRTVSYIPKEVFVSALLDEIYYGSDDSIPTDTTQTKRESMDFQDVEPYDFHSLLEKINSPTVPMPAAFKRVIRQVHAESHQNLETFRMRLERWFEMAMERNSGSYKKKAQRWTFGIAFAVTIGINVDSIKLASHFYDNPDEAKRIADQAEIYINEIKSVPQVELKEVEVTLNTIQADIKRINELKLPIGWKTFEGIKYQSLGQYLCDLWDIGVPTFFSLLPGWLITIFAVSLGAPFWFDTLNKLVNLRAAGKIPNGGTSPIATTNSKDNDTVG